MFALTNDTVRQLTTAAAPSQPSPTPPAPAGTPGAATVALGDGGTTPTAGVGASASIGYPNALVPSPDGKTIYMLRNTQVDTWDLATGQYTPGTQPGSRTYIQSYTAGAWWGNVIAMMSTSQTGGCVVDFYNPGTGRISSGFDAGRCAMTVTPDGRLLATHAVSQYVTNVVEYHRDGTMTDVVTGVPSLDTMVSDYANLYLSRGSTLQRLALPASGAAPVAYSTAITLPDGTWSPSPYIQYQDQSYGTWGTGALFKPAKAAIERVDLASGTRQTFFGTGTAGTSMTQLGSGRVSAVTVGTNVYIADQTNARVLKVAVAG
jgi:hypothetical protein